MTSINKDETILNLKQNHGRFLKQLSMLPWAEVNKSLFGHHSAAQYIIHLQCLYTYTHKLIAKPKWKLKLLFGRPPETIKFIHQFRFDEWKARQCAPTSILYNSLDLIEDIALAYNQMIIVAQNWNENDLKKYCIKHPVHGKLSVFNYLQALADYVGHNNTYFEFRKD